VPKPTIDLLRSIPLFADGSDTFLERLAGEFFERTYRAGDAIAEEGESGKTFVVIESGDVSISVRGRDIGRLGPGQAFGEMALIDKSARSATVRAVTDAHCYLLPVWSFRPIVEAHPEMAWALLEALAQRIRDVEARAGGDDDAAA
jgi:CRP/FNR family transcriptional regulator, cyclic AMP receptor protein